MTLGETFLNNKSWYHSMVSQNIIAQVFKYSMYFGQLSHYQEYILIPHRVGNIQDILNKFVKPPIDTIFCHLKMLHPVSSEYHSFGMQAFERNFIPFCKTTEQYPTSFLVQHLNCISILSLYCYLYRNFQCVLTKHWPQQWKYRFIMKLTKLTVSTIRLP